MTEKVKVKPWPHQEKPTEESSRSLMADEGLRPYTWSNGPGDVYAA